MYKFSCQVNYAVTNLTYFGNYCLVQTRYGISAEFYCMALCIYNYICVNEDKKEASSLEQPEILQYVKVNIYHNFYLKILFDRFCSIHGYVLLSACIYGHPICGIDCMNGAECKMISWLNLWV